MGKKDTGVVGKGDGEINVQMSKYADVLILDQAVCFHQIHDFHGFESCFNI